MYRIMIAQAKRDNYETLYKYLTTNIDGEVIPLELGSKEALDKLMLLHTQTQTSTRILLTI